MYTTRPGGRIPSESRLNPPEHGIVLVLVFVRVGMGVLASARSGSWLMRSLMVLY